MDRRGFVERLLTFDTTDGEEAPAQRWLRNRLDELGFETYEWTADPDALAAHPSFPDEPEPSFADRPSVGGVIEFDDRGPTLVLNGHVDVVPADEGVWTGDPFVPRWDGDRLTARGAADMKSGLAACVFAALSLRDADADLGGRVVVESVAGEEEGGVGAAAAALDNPYPFERDACIVAEPTELRPVVATEGSAMMRLELTGRSAHAATRWRGEDVHPHFERVREAFAALERERCERVTHPLYDEYPVAWPVVCGTVRAGSWASTVPARHVSEWRLGVAPGETVADVERAFRERLDEVAADSEWLREHPPTFERFSVQFEPSEVPADAPVVEAVQAGMAAEGLEDTDPRGVTYGADARHYVGAGVPTVLFGPGSIDEAHYPDETVDWRDVETSVAVLTAAAERYLSK
ncbi:M20 family metallopeptidase [Halorarius halobius]|uniref:M20 family metallopeptidase n=1 Tax=Halorarius halobius TaxID=2962671 RepID=UPI0020CE7B36|nr:M20/M25/M40 family metallo-hydrolase [Halorarius halobius]